jgi:DNA-binding MarR family transcriptional regulator
LHNSPQLAPGGKRLRKGGDSLDNYKQRYNDLLMTENVGSLLTDVARLMRRSFDERTREMGMTRPQWQVLSVLRRHEGINQGGLADLLEVEPITLCRMVDRLQEADLVERRRDPADRRAWRLFLSERAVALLDQLGPIAAEMIDIALEGIPEDERERLAGTLDRIRSNLSRKSVQPLVSHG